MDTIAASLVLSVAAVVAAVSERNRRWKSPPLPGRVALAGGWLSFIVGIACLALRRPPLAILAAVSGLVQHALVYAWSLSTAGTEGLPCCGITGEWRFCRLPRSVPLYCPVHVLRGPLQVGALFAALLAFGLNAGTMLSIVSRRFANLQSYRWDAPSQTLRLLSKEDAVLASVGLPRPMDSLALVIFGGTDSALVIVALDHRPTAADPLPGDLAAVVALDRDGREVWRFQPYDTTRVLDRATLPGAPRSATSGYFMVTHLFALPRSGRQAGILVVARDPDFALSRVSILRPSDGTPAFTLWQSGWVLDALPVDLNGDGASELVVGAYNNNVTRLAANAAGLEPTQGKNLFGVSAVALVDGEFCSPGNALPGNLSCDSRAVVWTRYAHPFWERPAVGLKDVDADGVPEIEIRSFGKGMWYYLDKRADIRAMFVADPIQKRFGTRAALPLLSLGISSRHVTAAEAPLPPGYAPIVLARVYSTSDLRWLQGFFALSR